MKATEALELIGRFGTIDLQNMSVVVKIVDAETTWGTTKVTVTPVVGRGQTNVLFDRVQLLPEDYLNDALHKQIESNFAVAGST